VGRLQTVALSDLAKLKLKRLKRVLLRMLLPNLRWRLNNFRPPSPYCVKNKILRNYAIADASWIETGTYLGETTEFLAKHFTSIITIEPSLTHFNYTKKRLQRFPNIDILNATSESIFSQILFKAPDQLNIYLDGHFSGDGTFLGGGKEPIWEELATIEKYLKKFSKLFVAIDDFRFFADSESVYPSRFQLIEYCKRNNLSWNLEQDIFMFHK
jgi:hypothetical protein